MISLAIVSILIFSFFSTKRKAFVKFLFLSAILLFTVGGVVEVVSVNPFLMFFLISIALVIVRLGKSVFIQHHAHHFIKEVTCGPLTIKGYWDSGNQCTDPLSSEPVHFIHQDLLEQYPELFAKTKRLLSLSTVTSSDLYPLYEIRQPLASEGTILVGRFVAPVKITFPFDSQVLLHHYAFQ